MNPVSRIRESIDQIEEAYEFMLAYAAQGRQQDTDTSGASQIREYLQRFDLALGVIGDAAPSLFATHTNQQAFALRFADDIAVVKAVVAILLSQDHITSEMVDNTNGLIAARALLTDLFFVDQVVLPPR